jgi:hypothetical protein
MAGEAAHEGEAQTCAHTKPTWRLKHKAESFSQQRSLGSQAERRRARLGRQGTEEQSGFTGLVNEDARAWVHGCVNVKKRCAHAHAGIKTIGGGRNGGGDTVTGTRTERGMSG